MVMMMTVKSISYQVRERNKCKARERRMRLTEEKAAEVSDDGDDDDDDDDDDCLPAYFHHDKIPQWWGNVSNDKGGNESVSNSHHT